MPLELSPVRLASSTLARYAVPLVVLAGIALAPMIALELRLSPPADYAAAKSRLRTLWLLIPLVWLGQLVLVGAAAPLVRAVATGERLSQLRAMRRGLRHLMLAIVPCLLAMIAIAIGGLAFALPALVLIVVLALTGASRAAAPLPAALLDSIAVARARPVRVAAIVIGALAVDVALTYLAQRVLFPLPKKPTPQQLAAFLGFVRTTVLASVVVSPAIACALAAVYEREQR